MDSKKWYASRTIIAGIVAVAVAVYNSALNSLSAGCGIDGSLCLNLPAIPDWVFAILGAFGIYGRTTANTVIK